MFAVFSTASEELHTCKFAAMNIMKRWTSNALLKEKTKQERPMQCPALRLTELWCHINKITISGFDYNNHQAVVYWSLVNKAVHILRAQAINQSKDEYCKHMHTQAHTHMYAYTHSQTHTYTQSQTHTTKTLTHIKNNNTYSTMSTNWPTVSDSFM